MEWALKHNNEHVKAGTKEALYGHLLRCPVCRAAVYHKRGTVRRPHFAHFSGNSNRLCELYVPGISGLGGTSELQRDALFAFHSAARPALIWVEGQPFSNSLKLRLPAFNAEYASTLSVTSGLGRRLIKGDELLRPCFAAVQLQVPPARFESAPRDPAVDFRVTDLLDQFSYKDNFFRVTSQGGVLEQKDAPLELGRTYLLITQNKIDSPPDAIDIISERKSLSWTAYRISLRDKPVSKTEDIRTISRYFKREVIASRPNSKIVWPLPDRYDPDGVPVFHTKTDKIFIRSSATSPVFRTILNDEIPISKIGDGLYCANLTKPAISCAIWVPGGTIREIRFEETLLLKPYQVRIGFGDKNLRNLISLDDELPKTSANLNFRIELPIDLLWKSIRVDGYILQPTPQTVTTKFEAQFSTFDAGSFGNFFLGDEATHAEPVENIFAFQELLIRNFAGHIAWKKLKMVRTKGQLLQWSIEHRTQNLLPLLLEIISVEVNRGIS